MKRLFTSLLAVVALAGCYKAGDVITGKKVDIVENVANPGTSHDYLKAFAAALNCDPTTLVWSIQETGDHTAATCLDGCITSAGVFTAPQCGSAYIGATIHVQAQCPANLLTGTAAIAIAQELLSQVDVYAAIVNPGTSQECLAQGSITGPFPLNIPVPIGGRINFYARLSFSCTSVVTPALPATLPATCLACGKLTCP